ncbi:MAG: hypothetical protein MRZ41_09245 [Eubacterium sp.]|nr:hypothetical protein [Eubacterium sp.]
MYYNNRRLLLSVFWTVLGAVLLTLSIMEKIDSGIFSGMGGALMAIGILQIIRNVKYRKNSDYKEKIDILEKDERCKYLRLKAWGWAGYLVVLLEAIGSVIAMILGEQLIMQVLLVSVALIVGIYAISYMILNRKY